MLRAALVGAYDRRRTLKHRGEPTADVDARIAELEQQLPDDMIAEAQRIAEPGGPMILGAGPGGHAAGERGQSS